MGKSYKKWWRFNDVPVYFIEPGVDPAMARRQFGYRQSWGKKRPAKLNFETIVAIVSAIILIFGGGWFFLRDQPVKAAESIPTATLMAYATQTATETAVRTPYIRVPAFTPTPTTTPIPTATETAPVLSSVHQSPVSQPMQQIVVVVTATPTPTSTPPPHAYEVIANYSQPEPMYSYISGWIVEADGTTPRPVGIEVRYPTGSMMYPRPNNKDIADGHYEFMVSPGEYDVHVLDYDAPSVHISVTENTRYEVSFRHTRPSDNIMPVRSNPWGAQFEQPQPISTPYSPVSTPTPTSTPVSVLYLPVVFK